jgi:hypothetical protein
MIHFLAIGSIHSGTQFSRSEDEQKILIAVPIKIQVRPTTYEHELSIPYRTIIMHTTLPTIYVEYPNIGIKSVYYMG